MNIKFQHKLSVYRFVVTYLDPSVGIVACQCKYSVIAAEKDTVGPGWLPLFRVVISVCFEFESRSELNVAFLVVGGCAFYFLFYLELVICHQSVPLSILHKS